MQGTVCLVWRSAALSCFLSVGLRPVRMSAHRCRICNVMIASCRALAMVINILCLGAKRAWVKVNQDVLGEHERRCVWLCLKYYIVLQKMNT